MDLTSKHGDIAPDFPRVIEPHAAGKCSGIAVDLALILNHDAAAKGGDVARHVPAHTDAATEAGGFADFFTGSDAYAPPELGTIAGLLPRAAAHIVTLRSTQADINPRERALFLIDPPAIPRWA